MLKTFIVLLLLSLAMPGVVAAQSYTAPTGIPSTVISVNKTVQEPGSGAYKDSLSSTNPKYAPGNTVQFHIVVTNTGNTALTNIQVIDNFPTYMVNASDNRPTYTTTISKLNPGQSSAPIVVTGRINDVGSLPADKREFCLVNQAVATLGNQISTDNAQLCVENAAVSERVTTKGGIPVYQPSQVTTVPKTGPEALALIGLLPTGALGYFLRKKTK